MGSEAVIYLDNEWNTYYPGQAVNGRVEYNFNEPKKVRGIHVKFKGEANTSWSESKQQETEPGKTENVDESHTGHEEYFNISYYLLGSNSGNEIEIPAGRQVYNFACTLPPVLPSSFEGEYGHIRYTVKVTLDRPWKFDKETKMAFTVINPLDLNLNPSYKTPLHLQMEKTFCCLCCMSAPLSVDVRAPVTGYCPGQDIPLEIHVENKSNVQVHLVKVFLRKLVTYRSTTPSTALKKTKDVVKTIQEGPISAGTDKHWSLKLEVPPIPPSNLVNCSIIDLDYDIKVECNVSGWHFNLKNKKYVTIGTVPLVGAPSMDPAAPAADNYNPSAPPADGAPPGGWVAPQTPHQALYPSLMEPVYKASPYTARTIQDRGDSQYTNFTGPTNFAPHYPTYTAVLPPPLPQ